MSLEDYILGMLSFGKPMETLLVGDFYEEGIGASTGMEIQFHKDGVWSSAEAEAAGAPWPSVDLVGFYCIVPGHATNTVKIDDTNEQIPIRLERGQALILDNRKVRHSRQGTVGDRLLLRLWIKLPDTETI